MSLHLKREPVYYDGLDATVTSAAQRETEAAVLPLLDALKSADELQLHDTTHAAFCNYFLKGLPAPYQVLDCSRPWILFWIFQSLHLVGHAPDTETRQKALSTLKSFYNEDGGLGGGPGQLSHLAPIYAGISALVSICEEGKEDEYFGWIDRQKMHDFLLSLKQEDGSFVMHIGGEVDVRGCYCALTVATFLNILTPELSRDTAKFIASCQTYEGGLASASHPYAGADASNPALGESHGGYAFCAVASYFLLQPGLAQINDHSLNVPLLLRWASQMQALPIDGGGFKGRTNKLVDGCYSWWCGGLFAIINAMSGYNSPDKNDMLFNREALQEYVLACAQAEGGGLRDKPGKGQDAYHTAYNLSGLSAAQHKLVYSGHDEIAWQRPLEDKLIVKASHETVEQAWDRAAKLFKSTLSWKEISEAKIVVGQSSNEVPAIHPVLNIPLAQVELTMKYFYAQNK